MTVAATLHRFLDDKAVAYTVIDHAPTSSSQETAASAHVPGDRVAKGVVLEDDNGYLLVVIPASHRLDLGTVHRQLGRQLGLATERELGTLFADCAVGAVPALGAAYGLETLVDDSLLEQPEVYLEAGDHRSLLQLSGDVFRHLMSTASHGHFSHRA